MQDSAADVTIAGKVRAGEASGNAELYDRHAAGLYEYCVSMLRDRERAVGALGITFMIAAGRLGELRDRDRLRPWLYALARDECRRRAAASHDTGHDAAADGSGNAALFAAAMKGLSWDDREVIELCLRHRLIGPDLADALAMPASRVPATVAAARVRLQRALGAVFVARTGRSQCRDLAALLAGWDGQFGESVIQRVRQHIGTCATCQAREWRELPTWEVLGEQRRLGEVSPPPGVRADILAMLAEASAPGDDLVADLVKHRAGAFGTGGFPAQRMRPDSRRSPVQVAGAAAGVAAAGAVVVMFAAMPNSGSSPPALVQATNSAAGSSRASPLVPGSGRARIAPKRAVPRKHPHKRAAQSAGPAPAAIQRSAIGIPSTSGSSASPPGSASPGPGSSGTAPPTSAAPSPSGSPSPTSPAPSTSPAPTTSAAPSTSPSRSAPASPSS